MAEPRETELKPDVVEAITADFEADQDGLLSRLNVVGMGAGTKEKEGEDTGKPCVKVLVSQKLDPSLLTKQDMVPAKIGTHDTDVVEVGDLFAGSTNGSTALLDDTLEEVLQPDEKEMWESTEADILTLRQRIRPVKGGFSVGHPQVTAGTIGTCVYDRLPFPGIPNKYYILSNNHVLANSNNARIGDPIIQPGRVDGGRFPSDVVARLSRFVPIRFLRPGSAPVNLVDAAIAEGPFHQLDREIYWIGYVKGVRGAVRVGELVQKTGRTTNYTTGRVTAINATVNVNYGAGRVARFVRQIVTTAMSAGGDSGSCVLDLNENAVGLLFAGSARATIMSPMSFVEALLSIRVH